MSATPIRFRRPWAAAFLGGAVAYFGYAMAIVATFRTFGSAPTGGLVEMVIAPIVGGLMLGIAGLFVVVGFLLWGLAVLAGRTAIWILGRRGAAARSHFALAGAAAGLPFGLIFGLLLGRGELAAMLGLIGSGPMVGAVAGLAMRWIVGFDRRPTAELIAETF